MQASGLCNERLGHPARRGVLDLRCLDRRFPRSTVQWPFYPILVLKTFLLSWLGWNAQPRHWRHHFDACPAGIISPEEGSPALHARTLGRIRPLRLVL